MFKSLLMPLAFSALPFTALFAPLFTAHCLAQDNVALTDSPQLVIDSMESVRFSSTGDKCRVEAVPGLKGQAVKFEFDNDARSVFAVGKARGDMTWEDADGISFWVQGTGSDQFVGLQFIWNDDYALRYDYGFWITGDQWKKITVPWRDFVAVTSKEGAIPLSKTHNSPAKLGPFWFGKWWYWRDYPQLSFAVDEIALEPHIPLSENSDSDNPLNTSEAVSTGLIRVQTNCRKANRCRW